MAILYKLIINNPNFDNGVDNWPPQIKESTWYNNYKSKVSDTVSNTHEAYFSNVAEFETWFNANRLTDATLIAALNEWRSAHGISCTEEFYEIPVYTPNVSGLFG
jgi:hypothetical protein